MVVYEVMRVKAGSVPFLRRHLSRLGTNAAAVNLPSPIGVEPAVSQALGAADLESALRIEWDGTGLSVVGLPLRNRAPMRVITSHVPHPGYRVKTTDRVCFELARTEARAAAADESLLLTRTGHVAEGTMFAVAWLRDRRLCLPSLTLDILPSLGRERLIELARDWAIPVEEGVYPRSDLDGRSVFAVTSVRGILEIATLDGVSVPHHPWVRRFDDGFWPL